MTVARNRALVAAVIASVTSISGYIATNEGLRLKTYLDPGGIPTNCYGETLDVHIGDIATKEECDAKLQKRVAWFRKQVKACARRPMPSLVEDAFTSAAYNMGPGPVCRVVVRIWNEGREQDACEALKTIGTRTSTTHVELPGLVRRRAEESEICLAGLKQ